MDSGSFFASDRDGSFNLYHKLASGAGAGELLLDSPDVTFPGDWSPAPDPVRVLFDRFDGGAGNVDVWMLSVDGPPTPGLLIGDGFTERTARFSPDGQWIAYVSDESGRDEVYVRSYSSAGKWQVSKDGGRYPRWTRGGREIVYLQRAAGTGQDNVFTVMAVPISDDGTALSSGSPRALFTADFNTSDIGPSYPYDVSVDSQQILVNERVALLDSPQPSSTAAITLIVNWKAALQ